MTIAFQVLSRDEREKLHAASLAVLATTGMRFESPGLLDGLARAGARVDTAAMTAVIPEAVVEESLEGSRRLRAAGRKLHLLNGVTSERGEGTGIAAKISGGCERFLDWEAGAIREATAAELLSAVRLGELLPEVGFVGNPLVMRTGLDGRPLDERMRRVETAALVAKNTRKLGSMEVWDEREIDFLVEIGTIARGSAEAYRARPCLVTAKETISPLFLDRNAGDILLALARRGLPCTIIPMPITGISSPVTRLGNAVVCNAEILGVMTAVRSVCPDALVGGGSITGVLDMRTSVVSFSAPEAILQDIAVAEVHEHLYGLDYLVGTGYTDAKYPNPQVLAEKTMKILLSFLAGRFTYPLGLINSGAVFSAEQALVDLEICRYVHGHFGSFGDFASLAETVDLVRAAGIRGSYLGEEHTAAHFRENWAPQIMDRTPFLSVEESRQRDIAASAHERVASLLGGGGFWEIEPARSREIDRVLRAAHGVLAPGTAT
jgi:trimethylamine---corrinoid protein Co-methyltransferase